MQFAKIWFAIDSKPTLISLHITARNYKIQFCSWHLLRESFFFVTVLCEWEEIVQGFVCVYKLKKIVCERVNSINMAFGFVFYFWRKKSRIYSGSRDRAFWVRLLKCVCVIVCIIEGLQFSSYRLARSSMFLRRATFFVISSSNIRNNWIDVWIPCNLFDCLLFYWVASADADFAHVFDHSCTQWFCS